MRTVLLLSILFITEAVAQSGGVAVELGLDTILIGEQTTLKLMVRRQLIGL